MGIQGIMKAWIYKYRLQVSVAFIMLLAAFMRFYQLDSLPPGLHPDEAANGLDVFKILEQQDFRAFYSTNGGREALFFYLQSIGVLLFDNTILGLRVAPALLGTLAVGAVYLWASSWFGRRAGLIAALLMAVTPWAVIISRDGFRAGMIMLIVPLSLWLYTKAFQTNKKIWFVLAGVSLGLGFYTYIAYRMLPAALVAIALYILIFRRGWIGKWWKSLALSAVALIITLIPIGIYAIQYPADIAGRPGGVSFTNPDLNGGKPVQTLIDTTFKTALMFNISGDENYRHNLGGQPAFNIFVGIMFLLGVIVALARIKRLSYFALLMVFGAMLLPEVLTAEGIPHFLRAIGALPAAVVLAAIGITFLLAKWYQTFPLNSVARTSGAVAVAFLLALTVYQGYVAYFVAWANATETYDAYAEDAVEMAKFYNNSGFDGKRYAVSGDYSMQTVNFLTHGKATFDLVDPSNVDKIALDPGVSKEFTIFVNDKEKVIKRLQLKFPDGQLSPYYSPFTGEELFVVYTVKSK